MAVFERTDGGRGSGKTLERVLEGENGPERQLFDIEEDPGELINLAEKQGYTEIIKSLHCSLVDEVGQDPEAVESEARRYSGLSDIYHTDL